MRAAQELRSKKVLSVDPGATTGWALWEDSGVLLAYGECDLFDVSIISLLSPGDILVLEVPSQGPHVRKEVFWAEGIFRYLAQKLSLQLVLQSPGIRAGAQARMTYRAPSNHIQDAISHGIAYFERVKHNDQTTRYRSRRL